MFGHHEFGDDKVNSFPDTSIDAHRGLHGWCLSTRFSLQTGAGVVAEQYTVGECEAGAGRVMRERLHTVAFAFKLSLFVYVVEAAYYC